MGRDEWGPIEYPACYRTIVPEGKYAGIPWSEVPLKYLEWYSKRYKYRSGFRILVRAEINHRKNTPVPGGYIPLRPFSDDPLSDASDTSDRDEKPDPVVTQDPSLVPSGVFEGMRWEELPQGFLNWAAKHMDVRDPLFAGTMAEIQRRGMKSITPMKDPIPVTRAPVEEPRQLLETDEPLHEHWQYIKFGKHKGKLWSEIPLDYLLWCQENFDRKNPAAKMVRKEIIRREAAQHVAETWQPPTIPDMSEAERMAGFEELVDTSQGTVYSVERWH